MASTSYITYRRVKKVSTAFCDFSHNEGKINCRNFKDSNNLIFVYIHSYLVNTTKQLLGFLDVKSLPRGVYFYAQRKVL